MEKKRIANPKINEMKLAIRKQGYDARMNGRPRIFKGPRYKYMFFSGWDSANKRIVSRRIF